MASDPARAQHDFATYCCGNERTSLMSQSGQKAKFRGDQRMSALASKADISRFYEYAP